MGTGSLWVRGTIYVRGDLEYADMVSGNDRQFGLSERGASNALAMTAGGNVVSGDPFRPQWGEGDAFDGSEGGSWNFTLEQTAIFNRREWIKTQATLPGEPMLVETGTREIQTEHFQSVTHTESRPITECRDTGRTREVQLHTNVQIGTREEPVYETVTIPSTRPAPCDQPTTERRPTGARQVPFSPRRFDTKYEPIQEMRRAQHATPEYRGPSFVPRHCAFGEGDPVPIQNNVGHFDPVTQLWLTDERVDGWDETLLTIANPSDPSDPTLFPGGHAASARRKQAAGEG